jgi:hypothetical protein
MNTWLDGGFWSQHFQRVFCRGIEAYTDAVLHRLLPTFDGIDVEAEEVSRCMFETLGSLPVYDDDPMDMVEAAEMAQEKGIDYYESMAGVAQAVTNLAAAGLYHLFEQQMMVFHRRQVLDKAEENDVKLVCWPEFERRIANAGVRLNHLGSWSRVHELRLVANTVKHGEGPSAQKLHELRHELFVHPGLRGELSLNGHTPLSAEMPMGGQDVYVTRDDLEAYRRALLSFWLEFGEAIMAADAGR